MGTGMRYATPSLDMSKATRGIKTWVATAPAGIVGFQVTNNSADIVHEMIVMYLADPSQAIGDSPILVGPGALL